MVYKQVILVRQDLKLPKGKLAVQAAHAAVEGVFKSSSLKVKPWRAEGMKKVVLKVKDKDELFNYQQFAKVEKLVTAVITDAGRTVVEPGTTTCMAIGPDKEDKIDKVTSKLRMV